MMTERLFTYIHDVTGELLRLTYSAWEKHPQRKHLVSGNDPVAAASRVEESLHFTESPQRIVAPHVVPEKLTESFQVEVDYLEKKRAARAEARAAREAEKERKRIAREARQARKRTGGPRPRYMSPEHKAAIARAMIGKNVGRANGGRPTIIGRPVGFKVSDETKEKIGSASRGTVLAFDLNTKKSFRMTCEDYRNRPPHIVHAKSNAAKAARQQQEA